MCIDENIKFFIVLNDTKNISKLIQNCKLCNKNSRDHYSNFWYLEDYSIPKDNSVILGSKKEVNFLKGINDEVFVQSPWFKLS